MITMEDLFPSYEGLRPELLRVTDEGKYSITRRRDSEQILKIIQSSIENLDTKIVTDATACIGGDSINFALRCKKVISIEMKEENYKALQQNIQAYDLQNIDVLWGDSVILFNWYTDILYIDPPWGGPKYKSHSNLIFYLSTIRLDKWIEHIVQRKNRPSYIFLKLPSNYNFSTLLFLPNVIHVQYHSIRKFVLVEMKISV